MKQFQAIIPMIPMILITLSGCGPGTSPKPDANSQQPIALNQGQEGQEGQEGEGQTEPPATNPLERAEPRNLIIGGFRGYVLTNRMVKDRFFNPGTTFGLETYLTPQDKNKSELDKILDQLKPSLKDLLGSYEGDGVHNEMKNRLPNGINMLLWYMAIDSFAADLASACPAKKESLPTFAQTDLKPEALEIIKSLCSWPAAEVREEVVLRKLWDLGMQADAPESEFREWSQFILGPEFTDTSAAAVRSMVVTMFYSPHFLLSK